MELLSRSYSEIVISPEPKTTDANIPQPLTLLDDGLVLKEGDMVHFIAKNLESKIKSSVSDVFCSSGMYELLLYTKILAGDNVICTRNSLKYLFIFLIPLPMN